MPSGGFSLVYCVCALYMKGSVEEGISHFIVKKKEFCAPRVSSVY